MASAAPQLPVTWPEVITAYPGEVSQLPTFGRLGTPDPCPRIARQAPWLPQGDDPPHIAFSPKDAICYFMGHIKHKTRD
jgi:hypothetical protein